MQEEDPDLVALKKNWSPVEVFGLIAGILPFFISFSETTSTSTTSSGGTLEISTKTTHHMDYVALGGGAIAVLCAVVVLALIGRARNRPLRLGVFAGLLVLGAFQIWRGIGGMDV